MTTITPTPIGDQISREIFLAELAQWRAEARQKREAEEKAETERTAAESAARAERWAAVFADVEAELQEWLRPFLQPHQPDGYTPSLNGATLELLLPFESGPWSVKVMAQHHDGRWTLKSKYPDVKYHVEDPRNYEDTEEAEWRIYYQTEPFHHLRNAVLCAESASANFAKFSAENAEKNAELARQAEEFYQAHKAVPAPEPAAPASPTCTTGERALLDALDALMISRGGGA